jgi:hypothetical protein
MMTVLKRDGQTETQGKVRAMDANGPITEAPASPALPTRRPRRATPLAAGSNPHRLASRDNGESAAIDEREAAELASIEDRLLADYGPSLGPDAVMRCISDAVGHFNEAPVRTYVMLLVERRATAQLRDRARRAINDAADRQDRLS